MATSCWEASLLTTVGTRPSALPQWNSTLLNPGDSTAALLGIQDALPWAPTLLPDDLKPLARVPQGQAAPSATGAQQAHSGAALAPHPCPGSQVPCWAQGKGSCYSGPALWCGMPALTVVSGICPGVLHRFLAQLDPDHSLYLLR